MKTPVKTVMLFAVAAGAAAIRLAAAPIQFPLEWNPTYDTSVPYEVEISPAKLQKLAGADPPPVSPLRRRPPTGRSVWMS